MLKKTIWAVAAMIAIASSSIAAEAESPELGTFDEREIKVR